MRILGLDVGEKRIGIAVSDPLGWTAQGHSVLKRGKPESDLAYLSKLCVELEIEKIILGLPRNMNGSLGDKAHEVREYGQMLREHLHLPVEYVDERLTTVSAEKILLQGDVSRQKRKQVIDKMAAVFILQTYLAMQDVKKNE